MTRIVFTPPTHVDGITGPLSELNDDATGLVIIDSGNWHVVAGGITQVAATVYDGIGGVDGNHLKLVDRITLAISEITSISADANILAPYGWSPDNSQIATAYNETSGGSPLEGVLLVNADNSGSTKIPLGASDASHIYDSAIGGIRWTPDGTKFIYCAYNSTVFATRRQEIRYCATDGTGVTVVATGSDDWYLLDVFADSNHILAKTENRSTHAVTFYKVSLAGAQTALYTDPTGAIYGGAHLLVERDAVLDPANLTALVATSNGLSVLTLGTPALTSVYSDDSVYRVTGAFVPPPVAHIAVGDPLAGLIRLGS